MATFFVTECTVWPSMAMPLLFENAFNFPGPKCKA